MSKEVKRYGMCGFESGIVEMEDGPYVDSDDYDALRSLSDDQAAAVTALNKHTEALTAERDALLAERDAMAKDAERYRWLRQRLVGASFDWDDEGMTVLVFEMPDGVSIGADCDKNIDAALQGAQP